MSRILLNIMQPKDLVENSCYLIGRESEYVFAIWDGNRWHIDVEDGVLDKDWPDIVFENPSKAKITDEMTLNEYQDLAWATAIYPDMGKNITYPTLGLCGESGEFAEQVKKAIRDDGGKITDERKAAMIKELSDVMWYVSACARELGVTLGYVAQVNLDKLASRQKRGVLNGSGDNR
jgi:NTP pyrophosphatase (non-canonical NTP hydrolase)